MTASAPAPREVLRLRARREFLWAAAGHVERRRNVVVQARKRADRAADSGAGFTATKKVGNSVVRNRARRRLREAARHAVPRLGLAGVDYVFIARADTAACPWLHLLDDVENALVSLRRRILSGEPPPAGRRPDGGGSGKGGRPRSTPNTGASDGKV